MCVDVGPVDVDVCYLYLPPCPACGTTLVLCPSLRSLSSSYELALMAADCNVPKTHLQATTGPDAPKWAQAMQDELSILADQNVWDFVPTPTNHNTVRSKWVFKSKEALLAT